MAPKIVFFIMTRKGYLSLRRFVDELDASHIDCVVAARDTNIEKDFYKEIKELCDSNGIRFYDRGESYALRKDVICFAISWRWLIDSSNGNVVVFHDSLLPRYRGFAPLVTSLVKGEKEIGVTALIADGEFDQGDILLQKSCSICYPIKISDAIDKIADLYCDLVAELGQKILTETQLMTTPQDDAVATYSLWLDEEDYLINWELDATQIKRFIDSVGHPYKGASTLLAGRKVRIIDSEEVGDVVIENRSPGKVIFIKDGFPSVVCGKGLLKIKRLLDDETKESLLPLAKFRTRFG